MKDFFKHDLIVSEAVTKKLSPEERKNNNYYKVCMIMYYLNDNKNFINGRHAVVKEWLENEGKYIFYLIEFRCAENLRNDRIIYSMDEYQMGCEKPTDLDSVNYDEIEQLLIEKNILGLIGGNEDGDYYGFTLQFKNDYYKQLCRGINPNKLNNNNNEVQI